MKNNKAECGTYLCPAPIAISLPTNYQLTFSKVQNFISMHVNIKSGTRNKSFNFYSYIGSESSNLLD